MKTSCFILLSACCFFRLNGQTVLRSGNDTLAPKKNIHVTILNPNGKQTLTYNGNAMHTDSVANAIKFNIFNFIRGDFEVNYEHRLNDQFSIESGIGVTYIDYGYESFVNGGQFFSALNGGETVAHFYSGFAGNVQFRWYPSQYETAITGYYFAPAYSYRNYKMDYFIFTGLINEPHRIAREWSDIKIQFGYQNADPYERIFWECFVSVGMRHAIEDYADIHRGADVVFYHTNNWKAIVGGGIKLGFTL